jgi:hypothetical protein
VLETGRNNEDLHRKTTACGASIRAGLTEADIAAAHRIAEASAEALARYDRRK